MLFAGELAAKRGGQAHLGSSKQLADSRKLTPSNIHLANLTLHYNVMPYVGLLTSGVAATAQGEINIPKHAAKA